MQFDPRFLTCVQLTRFEGFLAIVRVDSATSFAISFRRSGEFAMMELREACFPRIASFYPWSKAYLSSGECPEVGKVRCECNAGSDPGFVGMWDLLGIFDDCEVA